MDRVVHGDAAALVAAAALPTPPVRPLRPKPARTLFRRCRPAHVVANGRTLRCACVDRARLGAGLGVRGGGPGGYVRGREVAWAGARPSARGTRAGCSGGSHGCGHASRAAASTAPRAARQRTSRGWNGARRGRGRLDVLANQPREGHLDDGHGSKRENLGFFVTVLKLGRANWSATHFPPHGDGTPAAPWRTTVC